jgi:hypothetical protein
MSRFDDFRSLLAGRVAELASKGWKDYRKEAARDARSFVSKAREDLERWTTLLAEGKLSKEDFEWLLLGKKDLAELEALKRAGLTRARLQRFRTALVKLIAGTAFEVFL